MTTAQAFAHTRDLYRQATKAHLDALNAADAEAGPEPEDLNDDAAWDVYTLACDEIFANHRVHELREEMRAAGDALLLAFKRHAEEAAPEQVELLNGLFERAERYHSTRSEILRLAEAAQL